MLRQGFAVLFAVLASAAPALGADATVGTTGTSFDPDAVTVGVGEKVTITNSSQGFHNLKWADRAQAELDPSSDPWSVERRFTTAGSYTFMCEVHAGMDGTVTVTDPATTYTWVGNNGGNWETASNWSPQGVPGTSPTDRVTIGNGSLVEMDGDHAVARLDLAGQSGLLGGGTLTVTGGGTWSDGHMLGRAILATGSVVSWTGGALHAGEVENRGALTIGGVQFGDGQPGEDDALLDNQGTLTVAGDVGDASEGAARIQNPGTLAGSGALGPALSNSGLVRAQGGVLDLQGGSLLPNPGDYSAALGATLRFSGNTDGDTGATVSAVGTVEVPGSLRLPGSGDHLAAGRLVVDGLLALGTGSTAALDVDGGTLVVFGQLNVAGGTETWTGAALRGPGTLRVAGTTTLAGVSIGSPTTLHLQGPGTVETLKFGDGDSAPDAAPQLLVQSLLSLAPNASFVDASAGGAPRLMVAEGGTLALGTRQLVLPAAFTTSGTLAVTLASAEQFGRLSVAGPVTLGGKLAVEGAFSPTEPLRLIVAGAQPSGGFASVTDGFEAVADATGVLLKAKPKAEPTASPEPTPTPTPQPTPTATPAPTPTALPAFSRLVRLPKCAKRRSVRVVLLAGARSVRVLLGRRTLKRSLRSFTLRRLPKRAFTLKFEVTLVDGRIVKGSKRFGACRRR